MTSLFKKMNLKTWLYWSVEGVGILILLLSLVAKIKPFLPKKEDKKEEKKEDKAKD